ncbi:hypothetical protein CLAFUW4_09917 [Fulvia fulva]|uniref:uncharacterized protein n=1 Tax=Passalora fulva TaxID=5499 RepID=UPI002852C5D7|nr:uncharacterized protein CLAFUR5_20287 [Fulvia fulva]KAK4615325.1 hypothetical protein CLAFUR4_09922 [Fulvia fulva]KAK4616768.1 hypothetical protein CLAFUR0_09916 [Fulvia fulva]WMI39033.1 hypothetical protein CLAFUR5_20287 [Fulvia fulva]WPV19500.1 hypothetical protein CLAFUW4_09917 [Fulvia fulva]WPV33770.1 hypothetical protein CLAFUW7_09919 [Fulvia fulva]
MAAVGTPNMQHVTAPRIALVVSNNSNESDGTGNPCSKPRVVRNDEPLKIDMAEKFLNTINRTGLNTSNIAFSTISNLPSGYSCWFAPRPQRPGQSVTYDIYIAGHPSGKDFLSYLAFFDHFAWLQLYGLTGGCQCCLCTGRSRNRTEGLRTPLPPTLAIPQVIQLPQQTIASVPARALLAAAAVPPAVALPMSSGQSISAAPAPTLQNLFTTNGIASASTANIAHSAKTAPPTTSMQQVVMPAAPNTPFPQPQTGNFMAGDGMTPPTNDQALGETINNPDLRQDMDGDIDMMNLEDEHVRDEPEIGGEPQAGQRANIGSVSYWTARAEQQRVVENAAADAQQDPVLDTRVNLWPFQQRPATISAAQYAALASPLDAFRPGADPNVMLYEGISHEEVLAFFSRTNYNRDDAI